MSVIRDKMVADKDPKVQDNRRALLNLLSRLGSNVGVKLGITFQIHRGDSWKCDTTRTTHHPGKLVPGDIRGMEETWVAKGVKQLLL